MNVALLTRDPIEQPGSRLRALQWIPHLERAGVTARVLPWSVRSRADVARYAVAAAGLARWADCVVLFKPCQPPRLIDVLRRLCGRLLVDFDDAVWAPTPDHPPERWHNGLRHRLIHAIERADGVLVGSHGLAEWCGASVPGARVTWMPTCVDLDDYPEPHYPDAADPGGRRPVVGWIGASLNLRDLYPLAPVLAPMVGEGRATLTVVSDRPVELAGVGTRFVPWSLEREAADLRAMDIGVMPLTDSERARGRCGFKAIQYMATGLPVVASPVPGPSEVVTDGRTGYLADTPHEWRDRIEAMLHDPALRWRLGSEGRQDAESRFSIQANLSRFVETLQP